MRILFTGSRFLFDPVINILANDYDFGVLTFNNDNDIYDSNVKVFKSKYFSFGISKIFKLFRIQSNTPGLIINLDKVVKDFSPDIIITTDFLKPVFLQCLKFSPKVKLVLLIETKGYPKNFLKRIYQYLMLLVLRISVDKVTKVICQTKDSYSFMSKYIPSDKLCILEPPINDIFLNVKHSHEIRRRIIYPARFIELKRHTILIKALEILNNDGFEIKATLIGDDSKIKNDLIKYVNKKKLGDYIGFIDRVNQKEMPNVYIEHDIVFLGSNREAIGMIVPEGMACGLATLTSRDVGANTYVRDGYTGVIFETDNIDDLAQKIRDIYSMDIVSMGIIGKKYITENYNTKSVSERFIEILSSLK